VQDFQPLSNAHVNRSDFFKISAQFKHKQQQQQQQQQQQRKTAIMKVPHSPSMPALSRNEDTDDTSSIGSTSTVQQHRNQAGNNNHHKADNNHHKADSVMQRATTTRATTTPNFTEIAQVETAIPPHSDYKKVLVTGGAGFIGGHVAQFLLERGDDVVIIDEVNDCYDVRIKETNLKLLRAAFPDEKRLKIYRGDICDEDLMLRIFETDGPQWVCHMAARAGVRPSIADPYIYIHSNIKGTTHLMELSAKFGVKNFVFTSSSYVDNPVSPYAASKKVCEMFAYTYHHLYNLNVSGLRLFTVYGPRGRPDMAPFKFIDRVSRGVEIQQFGDGSSSRDYTYIADIVDGIVRAVDRPHAYEIFNIGKGSGTSLKDFIGIVEKHTKRDAVIHVLPDQPGYVPYTCADVRKAKNFLGYESKVSFEEGIKRTVKWYNLAYAERQLDVCPERQANGMGRAPSMVDLQAK
jgi:UDP-glucuronate 4-epimerase